MADLRRNTGLVPKTPDILEKHKEIRINELKSSIKQLENRLEDIELIEKKKIQVAINERENEIKYLESHEIEINKD